MTLVVVNLAAIGAIVALAAVYLGDLQRDPLLGLLVLLAPGLILLLDRVYGEPLAIAFVLSALVLDERGRRWRPVVLLATAVLAIAIGWCARSIAAGCVALASSAVALCLGPSALHYIGETLRILTLPQVMTLVAAGYFFNDAVTVDDGSAPTVRA